MILNFEIFKSNFRKFIIQPSPWRSRLDLHPAWLRHTYFLRSTRSTLKWTRNVFFDSIKNTIIWIISNLRPKRLWLNVYRLYIWSFFDIFDRDNPVILTRFLRIWHLNYGFKLWHFRQIRPKFAVLAKILKFLFEVTLALILNSRISMEKFYNPEIFNRIWYQSELKILIWNS